MNAGVKVLLLTPDLSTYASPPYMLTFWYHAYGKDVGAIHVYEYDGFSQHGPTWSQTGSTAAGSHSKNRI